MLHGPYGEDGTVQGLLELAGLPYVGAGVLGSAVGMDKIMMKRAFAARGLADRARTSRSATATTAPRSRDAVERELGFPCFVKPSNMGSSVGVSKAHDRAELDAAIAHAFEFDEWVVAEEMVAGREIEVAILGDDPPEASLPGEIVPGAEFYDYADKYEDGAAKLLAPAPLDDAETEEVRALAVRAFEACRCEAMARVDFFYTDRGFVVNELNTIPGFTPISMYPRLWEVSGLPYAAAPRPPDRARARPPRTPRRPPRPPAVAIATSDVACGDRSWSPARRRCRGTSWVAELEVHDGAGERAGDAVDELDLRHDHAAELVDRVGLGSQDHVVGTGHVVGLDDPGQAPHGLDHRRRLADLGLDEDVRS